MALLDCSSLHENERISSRACRNEGGISFATAHAVQNCILSLMVTGHSTPPARLHTLKTSVHPRYAEEQMCQDRDCLHPKGTCKGNR